jgi:hypothetical protein
MYCPVMVSSSINQVYFPSYHFVECPAINCGGQRVHPDRSTDTKQWEKEWAAKQARMREIEETTSFF